MGWWGVVALLREIVGNPYEAKKAAPNPTLQRAARYVLVCRPLFCSGRH